MEAQNSENSPSQIIIIQKTPDYVKRATKKYYMKQKEEDPDFMKKKNENTKKWREENRENYNERQRIIMRDRRARLKALKEEEAERLLNTETNN
jgi:hypothetical protein